MMMLMIGIFLVTTAIILLPSLVADKNKQLKEVEIHFDIRQHQLKADYKFRRKELLRRRKAEDILDHELTQLLDELDVETASSLERAVVKQTHSEMSKSASIAILMVLIVTLIAATSYWQIGNPDIVEEKIRLIEMMQQNPAALDYLSQQASTQKTQKAFLELLHAARLQIELRPMDPVSWFQFGEVQASLGRSEIAIKALRRARQLDPNSNQIKMALSRVLMGTKQHQASTEVMLLEKDVLTTQPDNEEALLGLGFSAFNAENYELAIESWEKLLKRRDPESEGAVLIKRSIQTAKLRLAAKNGNAPITAEVKATSDRQTTVVENRAITVSVVIADEIKAQLKGNETLFIFARATSGPPAPLAVVKFPVADFPNEIQLSDNNAMRPDLRLSLFKQIQLVARISQSGTAAAKKGDFEGKSVIISAPFAGKNFYLTVNQQL